LETKPYHQIAEKEFTLSQSCLTGETPLAMRNLQIKMEWNDPAHPLGQVEVELHEPGKSDPLVQVLKDSYVPFSPTFISDSTGIYSGKVRFTPFNPLPGKTGLITLTFAGEIGNPEAPVLVTQKISLNVSINTLESCLKFSPEPGKGVEINTAGEEQSFTLDASACHVPVEVAFCNEPGNEGCSGGSPEGKINVVPWKTTITEQQKIIVQRTDETLPGSYDITVQASLAGKPFIPIARMNVKIQAPPEYTFNLTKTSYVLKGKKAVDTSIVFNRLLREPVEVTSNVCLWVESISKTTENYYEEDLENSPLGVLVTVYYSSSSIIIQPVVEGLSDSLGLSGIELSPGAYNVVVGATYYYAYLGVAGGCWQCAVLSLYLYFWLALLGYTEEEDICQLYMTEELNDYIIHLRGVSSGDEEFIPPDAQDVRLSDNLGNSFSGEWVMDTQDLFSISEEAAQGGSDKVQAVGIKITNQKGYTNLAPLFGVVTLRAIEHIHGDETHTGNAAVTCANGSFQDYHIGPEDDEGACSDAEDVLREEKFHVRVKTQE
ncbi:MAG: hypothetical protein AABX02_01160, partial [archaeon]